MRVLAIDPGETNGWAIWHHFNLFSLGQLNEDDLVEWLENLDDFDVVVVEDYKVFKHKAKAHIGSNMPTVQAIGVIKSWAKRRDIPVILQPSSILPLGSAQSGIKIPKDHSISHQFCAAIHGAWYLMRNHGMPSALEMELAREKDNQG